MEWTNGDTIASLGAFGGFLGVWAGQILPQFVGSITNIIYAAVLIVAGLYLDHAVSAVVIGAGAGLLLNAAVSMILNKPLMAEIAV